MNKITVRFRPFKPRLSPLLPAANWENVVPGHNAVVYSDNAVYEVLAVWFGGLSPPYLSFFEPPGTAWALSKLLIDTHSDGDLVATVAQSLSRLPSTSSVVGLYGDDLALAREPTLSLEVNNTAQPSCKQLVGSRPAAALLSERSRLGSATGELEHVVLLGLWHQNGQSGAKPFALVTLTVWMPCRFSLLCFHIRIGKID